MGGERRRGVWADAAMGIRHTRTGRWCAATAATTTTAAATTAITAASGGRSTVDRWCGGSRLPCRHRCRHSRSRSCCCRSRCCGTWCWCCCRRCRYTSCYRSNHHCCCCCRCCRCYGLRSCAGSIRREAAPFSRCHYGSTRYGRHCAEWRRRWHPQACISDDWASQVRARPETLLLQGVRRGGHMRAQPRAEHLQGVRRGWHLRARPSAQRL